MIMSDAVPRFGSVVLDCPDPLSLSEFYARLLGWPSDPEPDPANGWASLADPAGGVMLEFQRVEDYKPPTWPAPDVPQMSHLDLRVEDLEVSHARALEIGATHLDDGGTFRVYADPAGHPFCLCAC
jgi:predicted enzyme related to lactoylglutathione lyase